MIKSGHVTGLCPDAVFSQRLGRYQTRGANSAWHNSMVLGRYPMSGSKLDLRGPKRLGRCLVMESRINCNRTQKLKRHHVIGLPLDSRIAQ